MVARFDFSQKDQESLVRAVSLIKFGVKLFFVGEGPNITNIKNLVKNMKMVDKVEFLGRREDVYNLMNKVDLNVLSTNHEGLSGVVLESLAAGKPFIGSDVVGVKEIVPNSNFLFPKKNPDALANKILKIKNDLDLQQQMVEISLNHVKKFDTSFMVYKYLKLYESIR